MLGRPFEDGREDKVSTLIGYLLNEISLDIDAFTIIFAVC